MKKLSRALAMALAIAMVLTTMSATLVSAATYNDTDGHWAESQIDVWSDRGVIQGDGGYFRPDDTITRAEVAQVTQNVISYIDTAQNTFSDVDVNAWYADAVLKLAASGSLKGNDDGTMAPNDFMTREQVMTMLARAYGLTVENTQASITQYSDYTDISDYATGAVGVMTAAGYVGGYEDGTLLPKAFVSRAEFVKMLDNMIKLYITEPGTYNAQYVDGITMIKVGEVTLNGIVSKDGMVVSPGVTGNVTITNSQVTGNIVNLSNNANVTSNSGNVITNDEEDTNGGFIWNNNGNNGNNNNSGSPTTNKYTVKFFNGSTLVATKTVKKNTYLTNLPKDPTSTKGEFKGWYTSTVLANNAENNDAYDFNTDKITKSRSFYAGFIATGATATPTVDPDATATPTVDPDATATPTVEPDATATPTPGEPTATPVVGEPTATPVVGEPTATPVVGEPTATPVIGEPTEAPVYTVSQGTIVGGSVKFENITNPALAEVVSTDIMSENFDSSAVGSLADATTIGSLMINNKTATQPEIAVKEGTDNYLKINDPGAGQDGFTYIPEASISDDKVEIYLDFMLEKVAKDAVLLRVFDNTIKVDEISEAYTYGSDDGRVFEIKTSEDTKTSTRGLKLTDYFSEGAAKEGTPNGAKALDKEVTGFTYSENSWYSVKVVYDKSEDTVAVYTKAGADIEYTLNETFTLGDKNLPATNTAGMPKLSVDKVLMSSPGSGALVYGVDNFAVKTVTGEEVVATDPPATDVPADPTAEPTELPATDPPATELPATEPPATSNPDSIKAKEGDTVKVEGTPETIGEVIETIAATGVDASNITKVSENVYTFIMPGHDVLVDVTFASEIPPATATPAPPIIVPATIPVAQLTDTDRILMDKSAEGSIYDFNYEWSANATDAMKAAFGDPLNNDYLVNYYAMNDETAYAGATINVPAEAVGNYQVMVMSIAYRDRYHQVSIDGGEAILPDNTDPATVTVETGVNNTNLTICTYDIGALTEGDHIFKVSSAVNNSRNIFAVAIINVDMPLPTKTPTPATATPTIAPATGTPKPTTDPSLTLTVDGSKDTDESEKTFKTVTEALVYAKAMNSHASEADRITMNIVPNTYREQLNINVPYLTMQKADQTDGDVLLTWYYGIGYMYYSAGSDGYYSKDAYEANKELGTALLDQGVSKWGCSTRLTAGNFIGDDLIFENSFNRYMTQEEIDDGVTPAPIGGVYTDTGDKPARDMSSNVYNKAYTERASAIAIEDYDKIEFYNCQFLSSQDTLYSGSKNNRVYFKNCTVEGQTDYIFGGNTLVFDDCNFNWAGYSDSSSGGHLTACKNSSTDYGYLIYGGQVSAANTAGNTYVAGDFGRPWGGKDSPTAMIGVKVNNLPGSSTPSIFASGWSNWSTPAKESKYFEYGTVGENGATIDLKDRNALIPTEWEVLAINPYAYLVRENDDWDPMGTKAIWEPVIADASLLALEESDKLVKTAEDEYEVSGNFTLPTAIAGLEAYDIHFEEDTDYLSVDENGNVSVVRPIEGTIQADLKAYIRLTDSKLVGSSKNIKLTITADPDVDPAAFIKAMADAKTAIESNYTEKDQYENHILDNAVVIPNVDENDGVVTTITAEYSGFINQDGTIVRNAYGSPDSLGNVKYTIECIKGTSLIKEVMEYDVSIPSNKADILYEDFEGGYSTVGGTLSARDAGNNSGYSVIGNINSFFDVLPLDGDTVVVSYDVYGDAEHEMALGCGGLALVNYARITPTGLVADSWNTVTVVINTADKTANYKVGDGEAVEITPENLHIGSEMMNNITFTSGTYDNISVLAHPDKTKAYSTFWKANANQVGTPQNTYLMRGLTILYSPNKVGSKFTVDGIDFPAGLTDSGNNGSWSNGVVPDGKNGLKFIAPADGTWTVYVHVGNNKTFYIGNATTSKTVAGTNTAISETIDVIKGETYYATVAGSKGNFLGSKFTPTTEGEAGEEVFLTSVWDFQKQNIGELIVEPGTEYDYTVKNTVNADATMKITNATGKFDNSGYTDWMQVNAPITLTVPVVNGSVITMGNTYYGTEAYTINGKAFTGGDKSYTYYGLDSTVDIEITNGGFYRSVTVVSPENPSKEMPTPDPEHTIAGTITGLDEGDKDLVKIMGKLDGQYESLDVTDSAFTKNLTDKESYVVEGIYGGSYAYTIPATTLLASELAPVIAATKVEAKPTAGARNYNFANGSVVPATSALSYANFVTQDGLVTFKNMKYHNDHGLSNADGVIEVLVDVAKGDSTVTFNGCAYAGDATMITATVDGGTITPNTANLKTESDAGAIKFVYSGDAATLKFVIDGGSVYIHALAVSTTGEVDPTDPTSTPMPNIAYSYDFGTDLGTTPYYLGETAVIVDQAEAKVIATGVRYNDAQHGISVGTFEFAVPGPVKIEIGRCQFGNGAYTISNSLDDKVVSGTNNIGTCDGTAIAYYGGDATTLTLAFPSGGYLPTLKITSIDASELPVTYDVTIAEALKGTVTVGETESAGGSAISPEAGKTVYVKTIPNTNYQVKSVKFGDQDATEVTANVLYSFLMPANETTVTVEFEEIPAGTKFAIAAGNLLNATGFTATVDGTEVTEVEPGKTVTLAPVGNGIYTKVKWNVTDAAAASVAVAADGTFTMPSTDGQ